MGSNGIDDFVKTFRALFQNRNQGANYNDSKYLDLGQISECTPELLEETADLVPQVNPVYLAFLQIAESLGKNEIVHAKLGINELLRFYLLHTKNSDPDYPGEVFLKYLYLIVLLFTRENYPYEQYFYDYLLRCYHPVCNFLLAGGSEKEIRAFMQHIVGVGKIAAQKQMDTGSIHQLLRNIETFAQANRLSALASQAKDCRYTLEH
jgi:hypothetical protein